MPRIFNKVSMILPHVASHMCVAADRDHHFISISLKDDFFKLVASVKMGSDLTTYIVPRNIVRQFFNPNQMIVIQSILCTIKGAFGSSRVA